MVTQIRGMITTGNVDIGTANPGAMEVNGIPLLDACLEAILIPS